MPLYEYRCSSCGDTVEVIQRFSDSPLETCQKCGGPVKKLLSSSAIQFKGGGWYVTDYSRRGNETSDTAGSKADTGQGADASAPAAKKESGAAQAKSGDSSTKDGSTKDGAASKESTSSKATMNS
ncbi:MAG: hypothetical protein HY315_08525 [Acidobacteria bacterium]|nr:hypothetical protein [Acidobacteriota bacterium]